MSKWILLSKRYVKEAEQMQETFELVNMEHVEHVASLKIDEKYSVIQLTTNSGSKYFTKEIHNRDITGILESNFGTYSMILADEILMKIMDDQFEDEVQPKLPPKNNSGSDKKSET